MKWNLFAYTLHVLGLGAAAMAWRAGWEWGPYLVVFNLTAAIWHGLAAWRRTLHWNFTVEKVLSRAAKFMDGISR